MIGDCFEVEGLLTVRVPTEPEMYELCEFYELISIISSFLANLTFCNFLPKFTVFCGIFIFGLFFEESVVLLEFEPLIGFLNF